MPEDREAGGDDAGDSEDEEGSVRLWLVDRDYDDKGLVRVVYATTDGERCRRFEWAAASLARRDVTAARDEDLADLNAVDEDLRDRYREEARRMAERHDPGEEV